MYNTRLLKKVCLDPSDQKLFSRTSRNNRDLSLKKELRSLISIEPQRPHKTPATTTMNFCQNTFYRQDDKDSFALTYGPRKTFNIPKPQNDYLRQFTKTNDSIDLASTMFSFGTGINNKDYHEFKTSYLIKFTTAGEAYVNHMKYIQLLSNEKQTAFFDHHQKAKQYLDQTNVLLFERVKHSTTLDYTSWKQLVTTSYDLFSNMNQMIYHLFKDLQDNKDKTKEIIKRHNHELLSLAKSTDDAMVLTRNESLTKKKNMIDDTMQWKIKDLQREENKKKITIYNLESEIKDLTNLLDKNKSYYELYLETKASVEKLKKENENIRVSFVHEIKESGLKLAVSTNEVQALTLTLSELEKEKEKLMSQIEDSRNEVIDKTNQNNKMKNSLNEKIETICMLSEELIIYQNLYDEEIIQNHITRNSLIALENQLYNSPNQPK